MDPASLELQSCVMAPSVLKLRLGNSRPSPAATLPSSQNLELTSSHIVTTGDPNLTHAPSILMIDLGTARHEEVLATEPWIRNKIPGIAVREALQRDDGGPGGAVVNGQQAVLQDRSGPRGRYPMTSLTSIEPCKHGKSWPCSTT